MNGVNRGIFRLLPIFLLLFLGVSSCSQKEERRILVIHSYEETYAAYPEFNRMIAEQFEKEKIDAYPYRLFRLRVLLGRTGVGANAFSG